jgi:Tfp pilus assembly protein PilF
VTADDFFEAGQWQEASRRFQRAIDADPDPPTSQTLLRLGHCLLRAQESPDAPELDRVERIVTRLRDGGDEEMAAELERELAARDTRPKRRRWRFW